MAREENVISIGTLTAAADLSAKQHLFVYLSAADAVNVAGATNIALGLLRNKPLSGESADVQVGGIGKVEAGAAIVAGRFICPDSAGKAVETVEAGSYGRALALESASGSGEIISVYLMPKPASGEELEPLALGVAASTTITSGTMVALNGAGYLVAANAAAAVRFVGIAQATVDNSAGLDGALTCLVARDGFFTLAGTGLMVGDQGKEVYNSSATAITTTPGRMLIGKLAKYISATSAEIDIEPGIQAAELLVRIGVAAAKAITAGDMVAWDGDGYLVRANDVTAVRFCGVAMDTQDNSAGLDGALTCTVNKDGLVTMTAAGLAVTDEGKQLYVSNATTVTVVPGRIPCGVLSYYSSATAGNLLMQQGAEPQRYGVAAAKTITAGNLVGLDGDGYAVAANDATCVQFLGIALDSQDNAVGLDGALTVSVRQGLYRATAAGMVPADAGKDLYVSNATTVTIVPGLLRCGILHDYSGATHGNLLAEVSKPAEIFGVAANKVIATGNGVALDGDGFAVAQNDATAVCFLGHALDSQDNTGGANGDLSVHVKRGCIIQRTSASLVAADVGAPVFPSGASNVTLTPSSTGLMVGTITDFIGATSCLVDTSAAVAAYGLGDIQRVGVATTKIVAAGHMVALNAAGYAVDMDDAGAISIWGLALTSADNTLGADGALSVYVARSGVKVLADVGGAAAATDMGDEVWQSTDAVTVTQTPGIILVGTIERVLSAGSLLVRFKPLAKVGQRTERRFEIPFQHSGAALNGKTAFADREYLRRYICLSMFVDAETAPGGADVLTVTLTDATTTYAATITGAAVHGENKTPQVFTVATMKANTDTDLTLGDTAATSANVKGVITCEAL